MELAGAGRHRRIEFQDSDSDDDGPGGARLELTTARASDLCPVPHRLLARAKRFTHMDDLSSLDNLDYVDLTDNSLASLAGLSGLPRLKTLIARSNRITSAAAAAALSALPALCVLNLAENELVDTDWLAGAAFAKALNALVMNGNRIATLDGVSSLTALETLVISHNEVEDVGVVRYLPRLKKLSASHNRLRTIPPTITSCHALGELRVAHNRLAKLPDESILCCLASLRILDVGHNRITAIDGLAALAAALEQVNVAGNPVSKDSEACRANVLAICPGVQIMDGTRISGGRRKLRLEREWKERRARGGRNESTGVGACGETEAAASGTVACPAVTNDDGRGAKRRRVALLASGSDATQRGEDVVLSPLSRITSVSENDDDAIHPDDFMAQARSKAKQSDRPRERDRKSRKDDLRSAAQFEIAAAIGAGGSSAWD